MGFAALQPAAAECPPPACHDQVISDAAMRVRSDVSGTIGVPSQGHSGFSSTYVVLSGQPTTTVTNTGIIYSSHGGVISNTTLGKFINSGVIVGSVAFSNQGPLDTFINIGSIHGVTDGIDNVSQIGTLINSGRISGSNAAIFSSGSLGSLINSGIIDGNIVNTSSNPLLIENTNTAVFGTLTGGAIDSPAGLTLGPGNILLDDDVNVGSNTLVSTADNVEVGLGGHSVIGNFSHVGGDWITPVVDGQDATLSVTGTGTLGDANVVIVGRGLHVGETVTIIATGGGLSTLDGNTYFVLGTGGLSASATIVSGDTLVATLTKGGFGSIGAMAGGQAAGMGSALDAINSAGTSAATAFDDSVLIPLMTDPAAEQQRALRQLAPSSLSGSALAASQSADPVASAVEQHELALLDPGESDIGAAAGSEPHRLALWGQALGGFSERSTTGSASGYTGTTYGLVSGVDWQARPDLTLGVALSYIKGETWGADDASGSFTGLDSYQLTGYGTYRFGPAFADGQLGFGYNRYAQSRAIAFLGQSADAGYGGEQYLIKLGGGYDIPLRHGLTLTPMAGLQFLSAVTDAYDENGSSADLHVDRSTANSLTQELGFKLSTALATPWGRLSPEGRLAWVHDYLNGPIASSGVLAGQVFTANNPRTAADGARLTAGAVLETAGDVSFRAEYDGEARADYQSHTGLVKITWGF